MKRRVVITGLGAMTAAGEGVLPLWRAALDKTSAISALDFGSNSKNGWQPVGAAIPFFSPEKFISQRKAIKVMARDIQLAVAGASLAMQDANLALNSVFRDRIGVIVGSGVLNHELDELAASIQNSIGDSGELDLKKFGEEGISNLFPLWLLKYLPNMSACHISIIFDLQGPNNTITTGSSGGLQAVGEAARIIERGAADVMLAGGAESKTNPVGLSQYRILGVLAEAGTEDPKHLYRPFDESACGIVVGEGAGFLVLEELDHAKKRGAKIYAEIVGFGCSSRSGYDVAMQSALREAGVAPKDVGYLEASAIGLRAEDTLEARTIEKVFGSNSAGLSVSTAKPILGFTGFASGALDLITSTYALNEQTIAPVANFKKSAESWGFSIVREKPVKKSMRFAMTQSFGLNGQCVSVLTKRYEEVSA